ncbi:hypothetical protein [Deinococcus yavapaiensis]|uniref:META domain-containing protein n=1 Tax=Deinococcus yavapaiensis KR-236 TaxID=694435 RepID=A0A318S6P6_9DEIO|nr:hypothetical protein [Deinococcus yavapaiensis]PYE52719.1 hypothetical protein DES52_11240 [Deinococcus yavapaiensis KR-236]
MNRTARLALASTALLTFAVPALAAPALPDELVGVWENIVGDLEVILLPDGRAFVAHANASSAVKAEPGTCRLQSAKLLCQWLVSGPEKLDYGVTGDEMTLAGWIDMRRTAGAGAAPTTYARRLADLQTDAAAWQKKYPVGKPTLVNRKEDPNPVRTVAKAIVYTSPWLQFMDLTILTRYYQDPRNLNFQREYKTFQATEFFFYPNGRFVHTVTLPKGLDAAFQPTYDMTTVWGRYDVKAGGPLEGDTVTLQYDGGKAETVKVLDGRRFLFQPSSGVVYTNQDVKKRP